MKEIIVLGAGASNDSAGAPLGYELVWCIHRDNCNLSPIINGKYDLTDEEPKFLDFEKFLICAGEIYPELKSERTKFKNRNGEIYYPDFLYRNKKYYVDELLQKVSDKDCIKLIKNLIFKHITGTTRGISNKSYEDFILKIVKNKNLDDVFIISFNFDVLLHEDIYKETYFDYLINFDKIYVTREEIYKKGKSVPLIKLNGSLDWGICNKCNRVYLYFYDLPDDFYSNKKCNNNCNGIIEPFIIMPHQQYYNIINILWEKAEELLSKVEKITIIGYSFPEYDKKVLSLFRNALQLNNNARIEVIDYCEPNSNKNEKLKTVLQKYNKMFPNLKNEPDISLNGFNGYLNAI